MPLLRDRPATRARGRAFWSWRGFPCAASFHFPFGWSASAGYQATLIVQRAARPRKSECGTGVIRGVNGQGTIRGSRERKSATPMGWRLSFTGVLVTGLPAIYGRGVVPPHLSGSSGRSPLFRAAPREGGCSCRLPAVVWAGRNLLQQPVHHWHTLYSNCRAVSRLLIYKGVTRKARFAPYRFQYILGVKNTKKRRRA